MRIFNRTGKRKNKSGASLIYAMLIMMVCTVIASVVLTAATAAAGRIVKTSETDKRYFAINSVVDMLKDTLEETDFTFQWNYQRSQDVVSYVTVDYLKQAFYNEAKATQDEVIKSGITTAENYQNDVGHLKLSENPHTASELLLITAENSVTHREDARVSIREIHSLSDIFMNASLDLLLGVGRTGYPVNQTDQILPTAWTAYENGGGTLPGNYDDTAYNLTLSLVGNDREVLCEVEIQSILTEDGILQIDLISGKDEQKSGYKVTMFFRPDIDDKSFILGKNDIVRMTSTFPMGSSTRTVKILSRVVKEERDITYHWKLDSIITHDVSAPVKSAVSN